ncbi:MAG: peptide ABC transporter substrate-binding protein [Phycisphaerae bacterium]|nr:peptide ABC transporter substrate-binding protein [Phycisphaerae bacterium]
MGRMAAVFVLVVGALVGVMAVDRPLPRADLVWIEPADFNTVDPQRMSHLPDFRLASALFEGLLRLDTLSADLHPVPALARSWEVSDDGLTYTFHLDPAAKWSNGDAVTSADFAYTWQRALMPETGADYLKLFHLIRGGREFTEWRAGRLKAYSQRPASEKSLDAARALREETDRHFREAVSIETPDERTLRVSLVRPVPYFLDLCAFGSFYPVHRGSVERFTEPDPESGALRERSGWTKPPFLVCNGPYVIERWRFKREMRLARNPHFRDPGLARSDSISIRFIENPNTAFLAFENGAADWHSDLEVDYIGDLLAEARAGMRSDVRALGSFGTYFWSFNCTARLSDGRENPFADAGVRRAFALAVDKRAIVEQVRRGAERPASSFVPPGSIPGYQSPAGLGFDPARARSELAGAGWLDRDGDGVPENERGVAFPTVELLVTPAGAHKDVAQVLGRMWERALGVRSKIVIRETKVYRASLKQRDYMVARGAWFGDYLDPTTFLDIHRSGDGNNDRGFSDARYDELMRRADDEPRAAERLRILEEAERYAMEEALPVLPVWHYAQYYLARPEDEPGGLRNLSTHPRLIQYPFLLEVTR